MGVETIIDDHDLSQDQGQLVNHGGHTSDVQFIFFVLVMVAVWNLEPDMITKL
jgi:hypothetical protein